MENKTKLSLKNITSGYRESDVLRNLSLDVFDKDILGIAGPNGAGKTTLVKAVTRFISLRGGEIELDGKNIYTTSQRELAQKIAVVPQETIPTFRMSVFEMISLGRTPYIGNLGLLAANDRKKIVDSAKETGVDGLFNRFYDELSGGEKQLVIFTRCLVQEPQIIILDEATSNLDIAHKIDMLNLVKKINREKGTTIVCISHDINQLLSLCSKIAFIKQGAIKYVGSLEDVVTEKILLDVFDVQASIRKKENSFEFIIFNKKNQ